MGHPCHEIMERQEAATGTPRVTAPPLPWRRAAFVVYAGVLALATHWPRLRFDGPVPRSDLWVHAGAFGTWTVLLAACAFFGRALGARNLAWSGAAALAYSGFDEATQAIPALGRTCAWDDFGANALGVAMATAGLAAMALRAGTRGATQPGGRSSETGDADARR